MSIFAIIATILMVALAVATVIYIFFVLFHPNTKNISDTLREDDEKYE
ncbi:MAG: hypothetical protein K5873_06055 [Treponema sp.]|nr:hypothetical protein [Treponema sp.]